MPFWQFYWGVTESVTPPQLFQIVRFYQVFVQHFSTFRGWCFATPHLNHESLLSFGVSVLGTPFTHFWAKGSRFSRHPWTRSFLTWLGPYKNVRVVFVISGVKSCFPTFDPGEMPTFGNLLIFVRVEPVPCFGALVWDSIFRTFLTESYSSSVVSVGCSSDRFWYSDILDKSEVYSNDFFCPS